MRRVPFSFHIAKNGSKIPFLIEVTLTRYAPVATSNIPNKPFISGTSPRIIKLVIIKNTGVRAKKGIVIERADIFIALIYRIIAMISRGISRNDIKKNVRSRWGISINGKNSIRIGTAYPNLTHAIKYSEEDLTAILLIVSVVAKKNPQRREERTHGMQGYSPLNSFSCILGSVSSTSINFPLKK
jgi:hypothetical protein